MYISRKSHFSNLLQQKSDPEVIFYDTKFINYIFLISQKKTNNNYFSEGHIDKILNVESKTSDDNLDQTTLKKLKQIYEDSIVPLEKTYKYKELSHRYGWKLCEFKKIFYFIF